MLGKLNLFFKVAGQVFEKWGYIPVIQPQNIPTILGTSPNLPRRFWFGAPFLRGDMTSFEESCQIGIELVGGDILSQDAEVISLALEILKTIGIRDFKVTLGNLHFLKGLTLANLKGGPATRAKKKVALLRGGEEIFHHTEPYMMYKDCGGALEDLKTLSRLIREFGYKESVRYDLNPFLSGGSATQDFSSIIFKIESGPHRIPIFSGGRRKLAGVKSMGFVGNAGQLLEVCDREAISSPKVDFLLVSRKTSRKSAFEVMKVLREHGYSVALDHSDLSKEELLDYAKKTEILNLLIIGDGDVALNEVRLIDVTDKIGIKIPISEIFDRKSGVNKLLRYHKRLEGE